MKLVQAQEADKQKDALEELNKALRTFTEKIKGPYFLGEDFSLVDIAIVPWIVRDYIIAENRGFTREGVSTKWKEYAELVEKRESVLNTQSVSVCYAIRTLNTAKKLFRIRSTMQKFTDVTFEMKLRAKPRRPFVRGGLFLESAGKESDVEQCTSSNNVLYAPDLNENVFLDVPFAVAVWPERCLRLLGSKAYWLPNSAGLLLSISAFSSSGAPQGFLLPAISFYAVSCFLKFLCSNTR